MSNTVGKWLGWLGVIIGVIGFFWAQITLGIIAGVLGLIGLASPEKTLSWMAVGAGVIALIIGFI
jgi:hypothetical protein